MPPCRIVRRGILPSESYPVIGTAGCKIPRRFASSITPSRAAGQPRRGSRRGVTASVPGTRWGGAGPGPCDCGVAPSGHVDPAPPRLGAEACRGGLEIGQGSVQGRAGFHVDHRPSQKTSWKGPTSSRPRRPPTSRALPDGPSCRPWPAAPRIPWPWPRGGCAKLPELERALEGIAGDLHSAHGVALPFD